MIANEEYLFHITDLSVVLSNSFFWPTEVSLHQIVELVVVGREELPDKRCFFSLVVRMVQFNLSESRPQNEHKTYTLVIIRYFDYQIVRLVD